MVDSLPFVQILDVPVPQMENQLVDFMQRLEILTPEQVIDVPEIPLDRILQRFVLVRRKLNSWLTCRLSCLIPLCSLGLPSRPLTFQFLALVVLMEVFKVLLQQIVDIPAVRTRAGGGPQGVSSGHCPLPVGGAYHRARRSFLPGQSSTAFRGAERHDDVAFRGAERQDDVGFLPGQSSIAFGGGGSWPEGACLTLWFYPEEAAAVEGGLCPEVENDWNADKRL